MCPGHFFYYAVQTFEGCVKIHVLDSFNNTHVDETHNMRSYFRSENLNALTTEVVKTEKQPDTTSCFFYMVSGMCDISRNQETFWIDPGRVVFCNYEGIKLMRGVMKSHIEALILHYTRQDGSKGLERFERLQKFLEDEV